MPLLCLCLALPGCALFQRPEPAAVASEEAAPPPIVAAPPAGARTAEALDTTSLAEREAAAKAPVAAAARLGVTIASLGDPAAPGFWLETPLVRTVQQGHVVLPATGASVKVELRPIDGPATAGSRISLAAMRLLAVPLTALPEIEVYAG